MQVLIKGVFSMKFILKTEKNKNGNKILSKEVKDGQVYYMAKNEKGQTGIVNRQWVYENKDNILNATVSIDGKILYSESKGSNKELEKQLKIVKSVYEWVFSNFDATYYKSQGLIEFIGRTGGYDDGEMVHVVEVKNLYDLEELFNNLYSVIDNFDPDYEAKLSKDMTDVYKHCSEIDDEDIDFDEEYRNLQWRYEAIRDYKEDVLVPLTFGWRTKLGNKGYDSKYAEELNKVYGFKGLEDVISIED